MLRKLILIIFKSEIKKNVIRNRKIDDIRLGPYRYIHNFALWRLNFKKRVIQIINKYY